MRIAKLNFHNAFIPQVLLRHSQLNFPVNILALLLSSFVLDSANAGLSATTSQTIKGRPPILSIANLATINAGNDFLLLGASFDGNDYFSNADVIAKLSSLGSVGVGSLSPVDLSKKLGDGSTGMLNSGYNIPSVTDANDPDGDAFAAGSLTGSATAQWYYMNGSTETVLSSFNASQTFCQLATLTPPIEPYIKISGPVTLSTQYGDPNTQIYDIADSRSPIFGGSYNPVRRFHLSTGAIACYAKPNMANATGNYAGSSTTWDTSNGFIPQANVANNFPTTGANGLYFNLLISGVDATTLTWSPITVNGVTATPIATNANTVQVTLTGPVASGTALGATAAPFSGPASFIIEGKNSGITAVNYHFIIKKWYVNRGSQVGFPLTGTSNHRVWCAGLDSSGNYKIISVNDVVKSNEWLVSSSRPNVYKRVVGGGLFAEWGYMANYGSTANFIGNKYYWTDNISTTPGELYTVGANGGTILSSYDTYSGDYGLCTQP